ncbi:metalloprotease [Ascidiimonas sp. W6]|uniref:metalloprotease n=1 Tax=Ascidiimonas meishanensis TaxID=3128903 RepID=UPI0030EBF594
MVSSLYAQNKHKITATFHEDQKTINIQQEIVFQNVTGQTLYTIYLSDWNNAYSSKNTGLANRFAEEFDRSLHLAKDEERGFTKIISMTDRQFRFLDWRRLKEGDLIRVPLEEPVKPGEYYPIKISYTVHLPSSKFTKYGINKDGDVKLRYWYLSPAVLQEEGWKLYSDKNLDDLYTYNSNYEITFNYPENYFLTSDLDVVESNTITGFKQALLKGTNRTDIRLHLDKTKTFSFYENDKVKLITNLDGRNMDDIQKAVSVDKVVNFIAEHLGNFPHKSLLVSELEYKKNPLYGLNQLPSFLRPFPEDFQFEMKILKTTLNNWLENTIYVDPRGERWVLDAIQTYLMIKYVETHYPDMKLLGNVSDFFIINTFHLSKMKFNDQYPFLFMLMQRKNLDQSLDTPIDSLVKFNEKIASKYKAGIGLKYLNDYLEHDYVEPRIKKFYNEQMLKDIDANVFEDYLKEGSPKSINWFFDHYIHSRNKIDFKIGKVKKIENDSLQVTIKNKRGTNVPISLYGIKNDSVVSKYWITDIDKEKTFQIARDSAERLVLNYDKIIPEFNQRDNWKSLNGFFSGNKKLQFKLLKDAENPYANQVFFVPVFTYNFYDEFVVGMRFHNKTLLDKPFIFDLQPSWSSGEKSLVGSGVVAYRHNIDNKSLYRVNYALRGSSFHFAENSRFMTITPSVSFGFRTNDFRSNEREFVTLRYVNVLRDRSTDVETDPDYSVLNARYSYSNNGIINYLSWFTDFQIAQNFSKVALNVEYRKLYQNNRQLNLRLFAGKFIFNNTNSDFFSFALDRPTDYLFDFNYLGRSENSGLFSQQLIIAEGGFKSKLENPFSNNWMVTANGSFNVWRWIELYGDVGFIKDNRRNARFVYDSGIRLNLLTDYFELYFPLYSSNGWEVGQERYDQKIRFIVTLSPRTLLGLFTRKWF